MPTWLCSACLTRALTLELPGKGYTHVSGAHQADDGSHNTLVTSTVEGLNLLDVVTADRIVARNVMFFRQSLEHSIWGPLGFSIMAEEDKSWPDAWRPGFQSLDSQLCLRPDTPCRGLPSGVLALRLGRQ